MPVGKVIDLRARCGRCKRLPRGRHQLADYQRYAPYCSFDCQEWGRLESMRRHLAALKDGPAR